MDSNEHLEAAEAHLDMAGKDGVADEKRNTLLLTAITHALLAQAKK